MPDWVQPVAEYMAKEGLKTTLQIAGSSVLASAVIGILLGTILTIDWLPSRALIRFYIEVWRGLPIIVTIFIHVFVILPQALRRLLPPLVSLLVNVIQNSTLAALIGAIELLKAGQLQLEAL